MFRRKEPVFQPSIEQDLQLSATIASIYSIVLKWWSVERENANNGNDIERRWIESVSNFDLSYFKIHTKEEVDLTLIELFEASEVNFVPNRIKLLTSQIELRFGSGIIEYMINRLKHILTTVYKVDQDLVDDILERYPSLWVVHVAQGSVLNIS